jgi:hypothetical protein
VRAYAPASSLAAKTGKNTARIWPTISIATPKPSAAQRPVHSHFEMPSRSPAPTAWLTSVLPPRATPKPKQSTKNAATPPRPTPASADAPSLPTKSVPTRVIVL